jgi:hypothetical protein
MSLQRDQTFNTVQTLNSLNAPVYNDPPINVGPIGALIFVLNSPFNQSGSLYISNGQRYVPIGGTSGNIGLQGNQGAQGALGPQGLPGGGSAQGIGYQGTMGPQGGAGIFGLPGSDTIGPQGAQGVQGSPGLTGFQGQTGVITGYQGYQGYTGPTIYGVQGLQGYPGNAADITTPGSRGPQGFASSTRGVQGFIGTQGIGSGTQGAQGAQGNTGTGGVSTLNGLSGNVQFLADNTEEWGVAATISNPNSPTENIQFNLSSSMQTYSLLLNTQDTLVVTIYRIGPYRILQTAALQFYQPGVAGLLLIAGGGVQNLLPNWLDPIDYPDQSYVPLPNNAVIDGWRGACDVYVSYATTTSQSVLGLDVYDSMAAQNMCVPCSVTLGPGTQSPYDIIFNYNQFTNGDLTVTSMLVAQYIAGAVALGAGVAAAAIPSVFGAGPLIILEAVVFAVVFTLTTNVTSSFTGPFVLGCSTMVYLADPTQF